MMNSELIAQKNGKKSFKEFFALGLPAFSAFILIGLIVLLLAHFIWHGLPGLTWEFLTESPRNNNTEGGIFPAIYGTVLLVFIMSLLGVPIGTATAVYLSEYAKQSSVFARSSGITRCQFRTWCNKMANNLESGTSKFIDWYFDWIYPSHWQGCRRSCTCYLCWSSLFTP